MKESTTYFYKVLLGGEETPVATFHTAAGLDRDFLFAVYGDTRSDFWLGNLGKPNEFHRAVVEAIDAQAPDFILHTGDLVHDGYDFRLWEIWFEITGPLINHVPLFPVIGNHEDRVHLDVDGRQMFEALFANPAGSSGRETFFSFDYGNCHFAVVSTDEDFTEGSEQNQWIRNNLEAAIRNPVIDFTFMAYHKPGITSSFLWASDEGEHRAREYLVPIAEQYGVDIVFNGHEHCYERSYKDGVYYITSGNGGALPTFFGVSENNPYSEVFYPNPTLKEFGFCLVHVNGNHLKIDSILATGELIDSFELYKPDTPVAPEAEVGCGCSVAGHDRVLESPVFTALALTGLWGACCFFRKGYRRLRHRQ